MITANAEAVRQSRNHVQVRNRLWGNPKANTEQRPANSNHIECGQRMLSAGLKLVRHSEESREQRSKRIAEENRQRIAQELAEKKRKADEARERRRLLAERSKAPLPSWDDIRASLPSGNATMKELTAIVLQHFEGVNLNDLRERKKSVYLSHARHCVAAALWLSKRNYCVVGAFLHRDHTSMLHSVRRIGVWEPSKAVDQQ